MLQAQLDFFVSFFFRKWKHQTLHKKIFSIVFLVGVNKVLVLDQPEKHDLAYSFCFICYHPSATHWLLTGMESSDIVTKRGYLIVFGPYLPALKCVFFSNSARQFVAHESCSIRVC